MLKEVFLKFAACAIADITRKIARLNPCSNFLQGKFVLRQSCNCVTLSWPLITINMYGCLKAF